MAPLNFSFHHLSHLTTHQPLPKPALSITTILSFLAILMAGMQTTLLIESNHSTPISRPKLIYLLVLEFIQVGVIIAAEVISFIQLKAVLQTTVKWLYWIPPCFVLLAFLKLYLDLTFTSTCGYRSYRSAVPFTTHHHNRLHALLILISASITAIPSFILIGWRQQWWWKVSSFHNSSQIIQAIQTHPCLSNPLFISSMVWALSIITLAALIITIVTYSTTVVSNVSHTWILVLVRFSAFPLLIVVTVAVAQLHDTLDLPTFNVLKELSSAVIIIEFMDIATALKTLFWDISTIISTDDQPQVPMPDLANVQQHTAINIPRKFPDAGLIH